MDDRDKNSKIALNLVLAVACILGLALVHVVAHVVDVVVDAGVDVIVGAVVLIFVASLAMLGPSFRRRCDIEPSWGHLGAILGHLGPSWGHLGPSCGHLGPSLSQGAVQEPKY